MTAMVASARGRPLSRRADRGVLSRRHEEPGDAGAARVTKVAAIEGLPRFAVSILFGRTD